MSEPQKQLKRLVWLETMCFNNPDSRCGEWCSLFDSARKQCAFWDLVQISASIDECLRAMNGG